VDRARRDDGPRNREIPSGCVQGPSDFSWIRHVRVVPLPPRGTNLHHGGAPSPPSDNEREKFFRFSGCRLKKRYLTSLAQRLEVLTSRPENSAGADPAQGSSAPSFRCTEPISGMAGVFAMLPQFGARSSQEPRASTAETGRIGLSEKATGRRSAMASCWKPPTISANHAPAIDPAAASSMAELNGTVAACCGSRFWCWGISRVDARNVPSGKRGQTAAPFTFLR